MKNSNLKSKNLIISVLYALSIIFCIYSLVTMYKSYTYISDFIYKNNLVVKHQLFNVISYYMNESIPYIFYAIVIWGIVYIINKLNYINLNKGYIGKEINENIKTSKSNLEDKEVELDLFASKLDWDKYKGLLD